MSPEWGARTMAYKAESLIERLLANAPDLVYRYRVTPPRGYDYINDACFAITGRRPAEFYANPTMTLSCIHPDDRDLAAQAFQPDPDKLQLAIVLRWVHPDGRIVWAEHRRVPIIDSHGQLIAIEGVGRDITHRIETAQRLAESERLFRLLAENARDMIYRYRVYPSRGTEYISPSALAVTGYTAEEMMRDPGIALRIVHPDDREMAIAMAEHAERFTMPTVVRYIRPDGRVVSVEHRNTPIVDATGRIVALEGIGRDVTESLAVQDRLRASESRLRELAGRLHSAREKERASVSRELHDELGQSLTGLKIDLTFMVRDLLPLGLAPEMIDRMQSMVGNIEVATETVRRLATSLRPPALDHLGLAAAIELEAAAITRRTGIRCRVSGKLSAAGMTPEQTTAVFRIVQESLVNVVRHASASAVKLALQQKADGITIRIQDNGRGMTPEALENPASIGLLGMRERAELIGAGLTITSQPGKGTGVEITVPVRRRRRGGPA